jgi:hypothetical protein
MTGLLIAVLVLLIIVVISLLFIITELFVLLGIVSIIIGKSTDSKSSTSEFNNDDIRTTTIIK